MHNSHVGSTGVGTLCTWLLVRAMAEITKA